MKIFSLLKPIFQSEAPETEKKLKLLKKIATDLQTIKDLSQLCIWDTAVNMPKSNIEDRSWQMTFLAKQNHKQLTDDDIKQLIDFFSNEKQIVQLNAQDKAIVRELSRAYRREENISSNVIEDLTNIVTTAEQLWMQNDGKVDFDMFKPIMEKIVSYKQEIAKSIDAHDTPYNVLLDEYESGMTTKELDTIFEKLKKELIPLIQKLSSKKPDASCITKEYDHKKLLNLSKELLSTIGFDLTRGVLGESSSLFAVNIASNDVRLTTTIEGNNLNATFANILHEGGHGINYQSIDPKLAKTPLFDAVSLGADESIARLFEQIIGLSQPFWKFYFPRLQERFPEQLKNTTFEDFYKAMNSVNMTCSWYESDELTSNLHIIMRYEIERDLVNGKISVSDLPRIWNEKMQKYFGLKPTLDNEGPLQNSYWASGEFGYLPLYTIGNLYAAQIFNTMKKEIPGIDDQISKGDFKNLVGWLKNNVCKYGKLETPKEMILRVSGEPLNIDHYINHIKEKYKEIYKL